MDDMHNTIQVRQHREPVDVAKEIGIGAVVDNILFCYLTIFNACISQRVADLAAPDVIRVFLERNVCATKVIERYGGRIHPG